MCSGGGERGSSSSTDLVGELNRILDLVGGEDLSSVLAESLGDDVKALMLVGNRVDAEVSRRLRRFDKAGGYAASGALSAQAWARWQCNLTGIAAAERVEVSRLLDSLPQTAEAFAQGSISRQHATLIARTAKDLGDKFDEKAETILVTAAKELDPWRLRRATIVLRHCLEPDGVLADANEAHDRRFLYLSQTFDGIFRIDGQLDAEGGAALQTVLDALMGPPVAGDWRSAPQRRADAVVELAHRQLDGGRLPEVGGQKPHLMVMVEAATLSKQPGSGPAELQWAQPIPAETARRIACDAAVTPISTGAESNQPRADLTVRVVSGLQRKALVVRDRGCRFPGCDRPPEWTDAHHIQHWADGGDRRMTNMVLLCRRHHRKVHEEGWTLSWGDQGDLVAVPP